MEEYCEARDPDSGLLPGSRRPGSPDSIASGVGSPSTRREVSYFGPIYIRNNRVELAEKPATDCSQADQGIQSQADKSTLTEPVDISKYKIRSKISDRLHEGRPGSPKKFLQHVAKGVGLRRNDNHTDEQPGFDVYSDRKASSKAETVINSSSNVPFHTRTKSEGSDRDIHSALNKLDTVIQNEQYKVDDKCPFKISSTEDNFMFNKLKAKTMNTDVISQPYPENTSGSGERIIVPATPTPSNENAATNYSEGNDWIIKHRSKIAKLKRKFFESTPPRRNQCCTKEVANENIHLDNFTNVAQSKAQGASSQPSDPTCTPPNPFPKPPRAIYRSPEHYATESRATGALRKASTDTRGHHRRHSTEGILTRSRAYDASHRMSSPTNWDDYLRQYIAVVAIDFGTTYSGYAYCFTQDPDTIHVMRKQEGGDPGVFNQKTPTTILLTPHGQFHSFGYAARDFYHDLDPKEAPKWMFFDRFKMLLHKERKLYKDSVLRTVNGKQASAMKIFSYSLAYFKDLAIQELNDQSDSRVTCDAIRWVITVPAIWKASAKQFMRQAAYEAGIVPKDRPDQLLIALEPEAASIYCRQLRMRHILADDFSRSSSSDVSASSLSLPELRSNSSSLLTSDLEVGTRYMVVDCGGGTVDITVHQLLPEGRLRELHRASGGAHGSVGVDEEFEILLEAIFGKDIIEQFKKKRPAGWVDLMIVFESRKRTASPYRSSNIAVSIPYSFIDFHKKCRGSSVESAVKRFGDEDVTWTSNGMLRLAPGAMRRLFLPTVDRIKQAIGAVLNDPVTRDLTYLFLVGGFAESSIIQHEIRTDFGDILKVIIPPAVSMTIVKGAVYFGMNPQIVAERCSCLTYGVGVLHRFNPVKHPKTKLVSKDGVDWCTDIFDKFVHLNETVSLGDRIVRRYTPIRRDQTTTTIHIYGSDDDDVTYISDMGVVRCGTLNLNLDGVGYTGERREILTEMRFGDTEIKVTATDVKTGNSVAAGIDFISS